MSWTIEDRLLFVRSMHLKDSCYCMTEVAEGTVSVWDASTSLLEAVRRGMVTRSAYQAERVTEEIVLKMSLRARRMRMRRRKWWWGREPPALVAAAFDDCQKAYRSPRYPFRPPCSREMAARGCLQMLVRDYPLTVMSGFSSLS